MDANELKEWQAVYGWTTAGLGRELGISDRQIRSYRNGSATVPRLFELALRALARRGRAKPTW